MVLEDSQWEGSTPPVVLQLYWAGEIPEKLVENTDSRLPPPGVWFGGDVTQKKKKYIFLTRTSVNAAVSDLKSRLWENHQYLEPLRKECSTAAEFELSNKPNPHVINQSSAIHKSSKLKRWVRVIYQHFLLNLLWKIWICLNLGIWGKDELKQTSTTNTRGKHFKKKEITSQVQKKKKKC